jgi:hypothetical protein
MVPIASGGSSTAWRADVEGAHSSPLGNEEFAAVGPGADDVLVWMQNAEPIGMYCADETDGESLRACEQIMEPLYAFEVGGSATEPRLAEECAAQGRDWEENLAQLAREQTAAKELGVEITKSGSKPGPAPTADNEGKDDAKAE